MRRGRKGPGIDEDSVVCEARTGMADLEGVPANVDHEAGVVEGDIHPYAPHPEELDPTPDPEALGDEHRRVEEPQRLVAAGRVRDHDLRDICTRVRTCLLRACCCIPGSAGPCRLDRRG